LLSNGTPKFQRGQVRVFRGVEHIGGRDFDPVALF
jgi:hypothetical protein